MKPIIKTSKFKAPPHVLLDMDFEFVENKVAKKALAEYCKRKECRAERAGHGRERPKQSYRRGEIWIPPALAKSQKSGFKELICRAYGINGRQAEYFYERISLYIKKIYSAEPERFFIASAGKPDEMRNALMVRHFNPDGTKGGMFEVTTHFHGSEEKFIISQKSSIFGETVLVGGIALYGGSRISGGKYEDVLVINSVLNGCHIKNCRLKNIYASLSKINLGGKGNRKKMLEINSCVIKRSEIDAPVQSQMLVDKRQAAEPAKK